MPATHRRGWRTSTGSRDSARSAQRRVRWVLSGSCDALDPQLVDASRGDVPVQLEVLVEPEDADWRLVARVIADPQARRRADRKSTRLNSSHHSISYAVFCLKKKKT